MRLRIGVILSALIALAAFIPSPAHADTVLARGDILDVQVYPEATLSQQVTVADDGSITLALLGRIVLSGLTTTQAQDAIALGLRRYLRHPLVTVALHTQAQYDVLVLGDVKTPGRYLVPPGSHISDAIAAAGGLNPISGTLPNARVSIGPDVREISLEGLLRRGDMTENIALASGSAVYVPGPVVFRVRVFGAVDHPGDVELNAGDRLAVAIAKAGNSPSMNADLNHIHITHTLPNGKIDVTEVNLYRTLKDGDVASDVALSDDDVVYVPESAKKTEGIAGILGFARRLFLPF
jgi:polysaccharide export outer membrane protein